MNLSFAPNIFMPPALPYAAVQAKTGFLREEFVTPSNLQAPFNCSCRRTPFLVQRGRLVGSRHVAVGDISSALADGATNKRLPCRDISWDCARCHGGARRTAALAHA